MGAEAFLRRGAVFFCSGICFSVFCGLMVFEVIDKPGERRTDSWTGEKMADAKLRLFLGKAQEEGGNVAEN